MSGNQLLKQWRENQRPPLNLEEAAALVPVSKPTWSRWETGARKVDEKKLPKVAEITGLSPAAIRPDLVERARVLLGEGRE